MTFLKETINFELHETDFTAKVTKSPKAKGDIVIPKSVRFNNHDYIITSIGENAFRFNGKIDSIDFSPDSELYLIDKNAFSNSSLKTICFPCNAREFKEGWCETVLNLFNVSVSPNNQYIKYYDNKFLLIKTNDKEEKYNNLIFVRRNIEEEVIMPDFIVRISSFSFQFCKNLKSIKFSPNSQLISIEKDAFSSTGIESITFPPSLQYLEEGWCRFTSKLTKIFLSPQNCYFSNVEDKYIFKKADQENNGIIIFASRDIEEINVPSFIKRIASNSFSNCKNLKKVSFSSDSHLDSIGKEAFSWTSIDTVTIPPSVTRIEKGAFLNCKRLQSIEFPPNCQISIIEEELFENSNIRCITIPSKVKKICQNAFQGCYKLKTIEFEKNSELHSIGKGVFSYSSIEKISLPSKMTEFEKGWCSVTLYLTDISVSPLNSYLKYYEDKYLLKKSNKINNEIFDILLFVRRNIEKSAIIPDFVSKIECFSFSYCNRLKSVNFSKKSLLFSIGDNAFEKSSLKKIEIPSSVTFIGVDAFNNCYDLEMVNFWPNSEIRSIGDRAFINTKIKNFVVPQKVEYLGANNFYQSFSLKSIEVLSSEIEIGSGCFMAAMKMVIASFPNLEKIKIGDDAFRELSSDFTLFAKNYAFPDCF